MTTSGVFKNDLLIYFNYDNTLRTKLLNWFVQATMRL